VRDELFLSNAFFDPRDLLQVKYEMLRRVREDGVPVSHAAASFGVSRPTWYQAQRAYEAGGLPACCRTGRDRAGPTSSATRWSRRSRPRRANSPFPAARSCPGAAALLACQKPTDGPLSG